MRNLNKGTIVAFILVLVIFSGYGLAIFYRSMVTPATVKPPAAPSREQERIEEELIKEKIKNAKLEQMNLLFQETDTSLTQILEDLDLKLTDVTQTEKRVQVYEDREFTWTTRTGKIQVPTFNRHPRELEEVKTKLAAAAETVGSQLLHEEILVTEEEIQQTLTFGFQGVNDVEVLTHQFILNKVKAKAKLAFIIDDLGYHWSEFDRMMTIPRPMTFAVIPHLPRSLKQANRVLEGGYDLILHQPMEAMSGFDPGEGAIYTHLQEAEIINTLKYNLDSLPAGLIGANNHMGSKATADPQVMDVVLRFFQEQGLFFIDSSTTTESVVPRVSQALQVEYGKNNIFLDNVDELEAIQGQVRKAGQLALQKKEAIAIGHVRNFTAKAILATIDELEAQGIQIVYAKDLLFQYNK